MVSADGKVKARDFSFLVTEDKQESGPNLSMLGGSSDDDSDDEDDGGAEGEGEGEEEPKNGWDTFEPGSAIDQLLYAQKAVSGMEKKRPGESAEQYFKRKIAGMRMLNADAGSADAKQYENDVDVAIMNANTQWHWGAGDPDADFNDGADDGADEPLALTDAAPSSALQLTYSMPADGGTAGLGSGGSLPAPPSALPAAPSGAMVAYDGSGGGLGSGGGAAGALVAYDASKAAVGRKRVMVGSEGIRAMGALVPKAAKDCLSNDKLRPLDSGRGLALLEKMGWKKGQVSAPRRHA